jgi:hypothetical protein
MWSRISVPSNRLPARGAAERREAPHPRPWPPRLCPPLTDFLLLQCRLAASSASVICLAIASVSSGGIGPCAMRSAGSRARHKLRHQVIWPDIVERADPAGNNIGDVRKTEPNFRIVECFDLKENTCRILLVCSLRDVLMTAPESFFGALDKCTLADLVRMKGSQRISDFLPVQSLGIRAQEGLP